MLKVSEGRMTGKFEGIETRFTSKLDELRDELKIEINSIKAEMKT